MTRGMDVSGFANFDGSKTGETGKCLCRVCGKEVTGRRKTFCSDECVDKFLTQTDTEHARRKVFARDHGVCALCGLDTEALIAEKTAGFISDGHSAGRAKQHAIQEILAVWGYLKMRRRVLWDMDHVIAVVLGGTNDLENLRTLCMPCHKTQTKQLMQNLKGSAVLRRSRRPRLR